MAHLKYSSVECWRRRQESRRRHRHAAAAATDRDDHTIVIRLEKLPRMTGRILNCLSNIYLLSGISTLMNAPPFLSSQDEYQPALSTFSSVKMNTI